VIAGEVLEPVGPSRVTGVPNRIVSLAPNLTEVLFAVGAGDQVVGVSSFSTYPPEALQRAIVGGDINPSLERIVGLRPDLVLMATTANQPRDAERLSRLGLPVYLSRAQRLADIPATFLAVGRLVGREEAARGLAEALGREVARIGAMVRDAPRRPVLYVLWEQPLLVVAGHNHVDDLLAVAGGENVAGRAPGRFPRYSMEEVLARQPAVILISSHGAQPRVSPMARWSRWRALRAVREGRIHAVDGDLILRPGPRIGRGLALLARLIHPERFAKVFTAEIAERAEANGIDPVVNGSRFATGAGRPDCGEEGTGAR
jgi:iron complex transport system substrate-binding protein